MVSHLIRELLTFHNHTYEIRHEMRNIQDLSTPTKNHFYLRHTAILKIHFLHGLTINTIVLLSCDNFRCARIRFFPQRNGAPAQ